MFAKFNAMKCAMKASGGASEKEFERLTEKAKLLGRTRSFTTTRKRFWEDKTHCLRFVYPRSIVRG
ncbi:MAG: hypothetical protein LBJ67_08455 [Planctomycetaceae bacterium]|jgi:hypothetical protein|nr:hypothetical protein [Planctomycetaceae bacterium]